jgi:hypothetical protein
VRVKKTAAHWISGMPNRSGLIPHMSYAAIAEALGLSTNEVRRVERRALKKLHLQLIRNNFNLEDMSPEHPTLVGLNEPDST